MGDVYLLDTNIISYYLDDRHPFYERVKDFLVAVGDSAVTVSVVTLAEIEYGLRTAVKMDAQRQAEVRRGVQAAFPLVQGITKHTVNYYAELRAELFRCHAPKGRRIKRTEDLIEPTTGKELGIDENDLWIAAQSIEWNAVLVTNDAMTRIMGLNVNPAFRAMSLK